MQSIIYNPIWTTKIYSIELGQGCPGKGKVDREKAYSFSPEIAQNIHQKLIQSI